MRIVVGAHKGGTAKTTTAIALATLLAEDGPTVLVDGDHQQHATTWHRQAEQRGDVWPEGLSVASWRDPFTLPPSELAHVVVDTGPGDPERLRAALALADVAVVPIGCTAADAVQIGATMVDVDRAAEKRPELMVGVLLTKVRTGTIEAVGSRDGRDLSVADQLRAADVPVLDCTIPYSFAQIGRAFGTVPSWRVLSPYRDVLSELRTPAEV
jgi:cellulose biosynthesis protein BcsQ